MPTKIDKKKLLIMLPVFLAPIIFIGYLFWGNEKNSGTQQTINPDKSLFNTELPTASLTETDKNKLELYMQAQKDSVKKREILEKDKFSQYNYDPAPPVEQQQQQLEISRRNALSFRQDPIEKRANDKVEKLMKVLNTPEETKHFSQPANDATTDPSNSSTAELEQLLTKMQHQQQSGDPEIERLESVVEKLLDIQDPQRLKDRQVEKKQTSPTPALPVTITPAQTSVIGFYGLQSSTVEHQPNQQLTLQAAIIDEHIVTDGATITLRLLQDIYASQYFIPKGTAVSGTCTIDEQRVQIQLTDIIYNNQIFPIALQVYDTDGQRGIHWEGTASTQMVKKDADQLLQNLNMMNYDPSLAAQAATAGVQTVKSMFSRKVRKVQVKIKAGHKVLLKIASL